MRDARNLLLATADPVLDGQLSQLPGLRADILGAETPADCLGQLAQFQGGLLLLTPALAASPGAMLQLTRQIKAGRPDVEPVVLIEAEQLTGSDLAGLRQAATVLLHNPGQAAQAVAAWLKGTEPPQAAIVPNVQAMLPKAAYAAPPTAPPEKRRPALPARQASVAEDNWSGGTDGAWSGDRPSILRQKVVAFWGGKGGTGRTTMVAAVADLLSRIPGVRVCTVDLNPLGSSLAAIVRKETERNSWWVLSEALRNGHLTAQAVRDSLLTVGPRWSLVTSPAGSEQWCNFVTPDAVAELIDLLRADFDYILIDLPAGRTPVGDAGLSAAQVVLVVVSAFFPDVVDTTRTMEQALADGLLTKDRCRLVLSQWVESGELPASDVSACLELPVAAIVPLAPAAALAAARVGRPVTQLNTADARPLAEAMGAVLRLVAEVGVERQQKRGWFGK